MIKLISTICIALVLTACGSQESSSEKNIDTEKKSETVEGIAQTTKKEELKTEVSSNQKATPKIFAKDIFALPTLDGKTLHVDEAEEGIIFQEHRGKVVFLLFFGYRCPPCLAEIPILKALTDKKHEDLEIIAVEVQRLSKERLKEFKENKGINYTLLSGEDDVTYQFISYIGQRAQWGGSIPFLVALNPKGEVKVVHVGGMGADTFKAIYEKLSKEK